MGEAEGLLQIPEEDGELYPGERDSELDSMNKKIRTRKKSKSRPVGKFDRVHWQMFRENSPLYHQMTRKHYPQKNKQANKQTKNPKKSLTQVELGMGLISRLLEPCYIQRGSGGVGGSNETHYRRPSYKSLHLLLILYTVGNA